jgi:hypothetical protein
MPRCEEIFSRHWDMATSATERNFWVGHYGEYGIERSQDVVKRTHRVLLVFWLESRDETKRAMRRLDIFWQRNGLLEGRNTLNHK